MASVEVVPSGDQQRCFCALCTNSFLLKEDNLYRRRNLHDLCRLMEEAPFPPIEPLQKDELFILLEDQLKKRRLISLCNGCSIMVASLLKEHAIAKEYEAGVLQQQRHLSSDLAELQRHNLAISEHFHAIKGTIEAADAEDFKFNTIRDVESGLKAFRERFSEMGRNLEQHRINMQRRQLVIQGPGNPTAMDFLDFPVQLQVPEPTPGPSTSGLLALPPPEVNRKRAGSRMSDDEQNLQPKQNKLYAAPPNQTIGGPSKPDFKERVIGRAKQQESADNMQPSFACSVLYDVNTDRLSFCDVVIKINVDDRSLECGDCGKTVKQNEKKPGEFYQLEKNMKTHILHHHRDVWEFNCGRCGRGFGKKDSLEKHQCPAAGAVVPSDGQIGPVQISTRYVVQVKQEQDEMMWDDDVDMLD